MCLTKPKIPIYPRPVSPLSAEPLRSNPGDVFLDDSSDSYSDDEQRTTKRRRIETLGEQYLRGDGLFIMTAGLRGPLTGWVNPWSKKHGRKVKKRAGTSRQHPGEEVPETALRVPGRSKNVVSVKPTGYGLARESFLQGELDTGTSDGGKKWLKRAQDHNGYTSGARYESPTPTRKYSNLGNPDDAMSTRKLQHLTNKPEAASTDSRLGAAILKQPTSDQNLGPTPTLSANTKPRSEAEIRPFTRPRSSRSDIPAVLSTGNVLPIQREPPFVERRDLQTMNTAVDDRMLKCDWRIKRRSIPQIPPSTHLPDFEYRLVTDSLKSVVNIQEEHENSCSSLDAAKKLPHLDFASSTTVPNGPCPVPLNGEADLAGQAMRTTGQCEGSIFKLASVPGTGENPVESPSLSLGKMPPPLLSTQTSTTTNTNAMPSAQVVPAVQPALAESYPSTASKMIELEVTPTNSKASARLSPSVESAVPLANKQQEPLATVIAMATTPDTNWTNANHVDSMQRPRSREGIVPFSAFKSPPAHIAMAELDTQKMLAAITPLGFSTAQKAPPKSINERTPATATRAKTGKQKKRASFAAPPAAHAISSGSSQGSIKGSLKVSKTVSKEIKAGKSLEPPSQPYLFGKLGLDMETSDEDGGPSLAGLSPLLQGEPPARGAPILSGLLPTANTTTSNSSALHQDAQQELGRRQEDGQNGGEGRDDFNLASAMDDLGSFLETWDTDKEAKDMGSVVSSACVKSALKSKSSMASIRR